MSFDLVHFNCFYTSISLYSSLNTYVICRNIFDSYEQWFSNDRMTGYSDTLNAASAIASSTSCSKNTQKLNNNSSNNNNNNNNNNNHQRALKGTSHQNFADYRLRLKDLSNNVAFWHLQRRQYINVSYRAHKTIPHKVNEAQFVQLRLWNSQSHVCKSCALLVLGGKR